MAYLMTNKEFVEKHIDVAKNYNTVYMWGCFGNPLTASLLSEKTTQYPSWYNVTRQNQFKQLIGKQYYGFDCVNLTKAILWGWCGKFNTYAGGAAYNIYGVPDINADGMIAKCKEVSSTNWNDMLPGEGLWMPGHWGVYIGDGLAVECTPAWKNCVQITAVGNIGAKSGYPTRKWQKHGKLPWIQYEETTEQNQHNQNKSKVKSRFGFDDNTIEWLDTYKYNKALFEKLANKG